jgi:alpha-ketoglutarate-dependent taurine dioxygenase
MVGWDCFSENYRSGMQTACGRIRQIGCTTRFAILMTAVAKDYRTTKARRFSTLFDHQEQRTFVYEHVWRPNDVLLWDKRCTLHARTDYSDKERRLMRRVAIKGEKPV